MTVELDRNIEELIGLSYDAALDPALWEQWLRRVVDSTQSRSGLLILQNTENLDINNTIQVGFDQASRKRYNRDFRTLDLWTSSLTRLPRGQMFPSRDMVPQKDFHRSVIYNEFCRPLKIEHGAGAFLPLDGPWSLRLAMQRSKGQGEFDDGEIRTLQRLLPHLQRSVRIGREIGKLQDSLEATIERFAAPCVLLDGANKVIALNGKARELVIHNDHGLVLRDGCISFQSPVLASRLRALISDCYRFAQTGQGQGGGILKLPRSGRLPLILSVMPLGNPASTRWLQTDARVALLFCDPDRRLKPHAQLLAEIFGLTPGETRVACALASGCDLDDIARKQGVSINAVKFHLKSIYAKTGTHRQSEAVSLLQSCLMQAQEETGAASGSSVSRG